MLPSQRLQRLARRITARLVLAGVFGGVAAVHTLASLANSEPERDALVALVYNAIRSGTAPDTSVLKRALVDADGPVVALLDWPQEFWAALHHLWKLHQHTGSDHDENLSTRDYLNAGVSRAVAQQFSLFAKRAERALLAGHGDTSHRYEELVRRKLGGVNLVLERLPSKWEAYIRGHITFAIAFDEDPNRNTRVYHYMRAHKLDKTYGIRSPTKPAAYYYKPQMNNASGLYSASDNLIAIYATERPHTEFLQDVAHEVGHAVWDAAYSPRVLRDFLRKTYERAVRQVTGDDDHRLRQRELDRRAEEFFDHLQQGLEGLRTRKPYRLLRDLRKTWGDDYARDQEDTLSVRAWGQHLLEYEGKFLTELVNANRDFLVAWNEAWAEGFSNVLLRHEDTALDSESRTVYVHLDSPNFGRIPIIEKLIHHLLAL